MIQSAASSDGTRAMIRCTTTSAASAFGIAPNNSTPWYKNSCITSALKSYAVTAGVDSIGFIPEAGGVEGKAAPGVGQIISGISMGVDMDANGNPGNIYLPADGSSYAATYDVENRLTSTGSGSIYYSYAPGNRRVWRGTGTWTTQSGSGSGQCNTGQWSTDEVTFWGVNGQKLMTYNLTESPNSYYGTCDFSATAGGTDYYFGSRLIKNAGGYVYSDRLGSIGKFYPFGIERPSATSNGKEKFTGYFRDSETGNDYAVNRYMTPGNGRFITPDPSKGAFANPANPGSWNLYAYTRGDPINHSDPTGLCSVAGGGDGDDATCLDETTVTPYECELYDIDPDLCDAVLSAADSDGGAAGDPTPSTPLPTNASTPPITLPGTTVTVTADAPVTNSIVDDPTAQARSQARRPPAARAVLRPK